MPRAGTNFHSIIVRSFQKAVAFTLAVSLWLAMFSVPAGAQISNPGSIEIEEGGELWIEGSASVVDYTCKTQELSGNGNLENTDNPRENVTGDGSVVVRVSVPVRALDCGKKKMNRDMYEALKAEEHEEIIYELLTASLKNGNGSEVDLESEEGLDEWMQIETNGVLQIGGVPDTTDVEVEGKLLSADRFRVRGSKKINMKTFDVEPPTAMMGLIKASSDLTVHFDVTVRLNN